MSDSRNIVNVDTIECATCLEEIPKSVHKNAEADEYVSNYCGLDCYQVWSEKKPEEYFST
ncbi:MAG TPA: DUF3330 domain-containing protein [Gammaproteobacteria bacterium]|nr:DUF3330 domain-containing protein [Gammaproteobacteria bacterium]